MSFLASTLLLFSFLVPSKTWFAPGQAVDIAVEAQTPVRLVMLDFGGKLLEANAAAQVVDKAKTVDIKEVFPQVAAPGTYVLFAVPQDKTLEQFVGTPLVFQSRTAGKFAGPISSATTAIRVMPLLYTKMETTQGNMKLVFWYDSAPNTVVNFLSLAAGGFYDGLTFHRIVPDFIIQGGDPTGTGFGGPGYSIDAEFNDRSHEEGVLSMARTQDPLEGNGIAPRSDFANSAGSQFFICLGREKTQALDRLYTAFGRVVEGKETFKKIAAAPLADTHAGKPKDPPLIRKIQVVPVTAKDNPYAEMMKLETAESRLRISPTTQP